MREHNERAWSAWQTAFLPHQTNPRPDFRKLLMSEPPRGPRRRQSTEEQAAIAKAIVAALGGSIH